MKSRIEWIDICKSVAIFVMVFLHVSLEFKTRDHQLDEALHLWHMPIFFILSGIVLNIDKYCGWNNFRSFLTTRVKTLLIPYLLFGVFCCTCGYILTNLTGGVNFQ